MSNILFGTDIAAIVNQAIAPGLLDCTLIVVAKGARPSDPTAPRPTVETPITGKGFTEEYSDKLIDGTRIRAGDKKIMLIANSFAGLPVPKQGDKITIEGSTFEIVGSVKRDPAAATYTCQSRGL